MTTTVTDPPLRAAFGSETTQQAGGRERWNSRIGFYLAAIGSAIGFGNVSKTVDERIQSHTSEFNLLSFFFIHRSSTGLAISPTCQGLWRRRLFYSLHYGVLLDWIADAYSRNIPWTVLPGG